jgi:hypothetical protein
VKENDGWTLNLATSVLSHIVVLSRSSPASSQAAVVLTPHVSSRSRSRGSRRCTFTSNSSPVHHHIQVGIHPSPHCATALSSPGPEGKIKSQTSTSHIFAPPFPRATDRANPDSRHSHQYATRFGPGLQRGTPLSKGKKEKGNRALSLSEPMHSTQPTDVFPCGQTRRLQHENNGGRGGGGGGAAASSRRSEHPAAASPGSPQRPTYSRGSSGGASYGAGAQPGRAVGGGGGMSRDVRASRDPDPIVM